MGRKHHLIRDRQNDEDERKERKKTELNLEANISEKGKPHEIDDKHQGKK